MAYLPGYTLGCPDKSAELYKRMVKKKCVWLEQFWLAFFPPFKAAALFLHHLFFRQRQQNVFEKCHILIMHDAYEALAPASPFFLPKATKCFPKNATSWCVLSCFLGMATECSTSQKLSPRSFHRKYCAILPKLTISLQKRDACYSPLF